ncbi:MAG: hemolysin family protein [Planctomycetota bacterium]
MNLPPLAAIPLPVPPAEIPLGTPEAIGLAALALFFSGLFAMVRSALLHSVPGRVLARAETDDDRARLRPLLGKADALRTSASTYTITSQMAFLILVLGLVFRDDFTWPRLVVALLSTVPVLVFVSEVLPATLRGSKQDALLVRFLPLFHVLQLPLAAPVYGLEVTRRWTMRLLRIPERPKSAREIVEGLRDVIEESDLKGDLGETEKEIIENAVEFQDVDVAEVMTPRTEVSAVELSCSLGEVAQIVSEGGHGRIPVYEGNLDAVVGVVSARDVIRVLAEQGGLERCALGEVMRPAVFVPETKLISELLQEFRRDKQKIAIVLDEYGGTAGLVTMGDILAEIVGEMGDEFDATEDEPIRVLDEGLAEVQASARVSEVNETLALDLPEEEDYETLAGYVLAQLGRFPKSGEAFLADDVEYTVTDANDRRVLRVRVRKLAQQEL